MHDDSNAKQDHILFSLCETTVADKVYTLWYRQIRMLLAAGTVATEGSSAVGQTCHTINLLPGPVTLGTSTAGMLPEDVAA